MTFESHQISLKFCSTVWLIFWSSLKAWNFNFFENTILDFSEHDLTSWNCCHYKWNLLPITPTFYKQCMCQKILTYNSAIKKSSALNFWMKKFVKNVCEKLIPEVIINSSDINVPSEHVEVFWHSIRKWKFFFQRFLDETDIEMTNIYIIIF